MKHKRELTSTFLESSRGNRKYFFNLKRDRVGSMFVTAVETTRKPNGTEIRNEIFIYEEDIEQYQEALADIVAELKRYSAPRQ